ncbi:MAG: hypothetical protein R3253_13010, partial [Longimicrobiales bacterium]|nr:hypothetical protein [Longimicrobiales bacterium]
MVGMVVLRPRILGKLLVEHEGISPKALKSALEGERRDRERVGETLVRLGAATPEAVARALGIQLGVPVADAPLEPEEGALVLVQPDLLRAHGLVPLSVGPKVIRVAMADPLDLAAIDDVQFQTGRRVEPVVSTPEAVAEALTRLELDPAPEVSGSASGGRSKGSSSEADDGSRSGRVQASTGGKGAGVQHDSGEEGGPDVGSGRRAGGDHVG